MYCKSKEKRNKILKKACVAFLCIQLITPIYAEQEGPQGIGVQTTPDALGLNVKSAVLVEASTGQVIFEANATEALPPASITKLMTEYIITDYVSKGKLKWDDIITTTKNAAMVPSDASKVFLAEGDKHRLEEMFIAMAIGSANDATIALAEHVAGTEQKFVKLMNETAKNIGMIHSHFINCTGLGRGDMPVEYRPPGEGENVMSAHDIGVLARKMVADNPKFAKYTAIQSYKFRPRDKTPVTNLNWMLGVNKSIPNFRKFAYEGLDGLKTGFTNEAQYCFVGTALRKGMRLVSVVMGAKSKESRFSETARVLDYGFNNYELKTIAPPKSVIDGVERIEIKRGVDTTVAVVTDSAVGFILSKEEKVGKVPFEVELLPEEQRKAPIQKGQKVAVLKFSSEKQKNLKVYLIASEAIEEGSWFRLFFRGIGAFIMDLFKGMGKLF